MDHQEENQDAARARESDDEDLAMLMGLCSTKDEDERKPKSINGTALTYDEVMTKHKCDWIPSYPENPSRITQPYARCSELGLVDRCRRLQMRYATEDLVTLQHSEELVEKAKATANMTLEELQDFFTKYDSFYCNNASFECALAAIGCTLETMEHIIQEKVRNGFALIRPPGHHSMHNEFCGYSIFNNVAIAAKHALEAFNLDRILIVDWDVHHGQGTQYAFYDDPRVLYFSIHRYENGMYWPNLRESDYDFTGKGKGKGYNINVPLNKIGMTDSDYFAVLQQILMPVAYEFRPQLVVVSNGFDAALGDQKGEMEVSPSAYAHFIHMLGSLGQGRVCVVLEGGYCIKSLSEGCALTLRSLLNDPCPLLPPLQEPSDSVTETILNVIKVLHPYWSCFRYQKSLEVGELCPFDDVNTLPPRPGVEFITEENRPHTYKNDDAYPVLSDEDTAALDKRIDALIAETSLTFAPHRTCMVFDADMRAHKNMSFKGHPERPDRISRIYNQHIEWGLYGRCLQVQSRLATEEELATVHSEAYISKIKDTTDKTQQELDNVMEWRMNSIFVCKDTYRCALLSCGSVLSVVDTVLSGKAQNGVAIVRPPGHHAECDKAMGFCFFNNVAVAVKYAQNKFGVKRILILDWDVHHGNGTQHQFQDDPSVLFISLHRYDNGGFYPASDDGNYTKVGSGDGTGYNINVSWSGGFMGDSEYISAFQQIVMPVAYEFAPDLVLVSAGFDAARGDPLGGYDITPAGYGHMTHMLSGLANGRVVVLLEGGYNLYSIAASMATCTSVLLGDQCPTMPAPQPCQNAVQTICDVLDVHQQYWKSLKFRVKIPTIAQVMDMEEKMKQGPGSTGPSVDEVTEKMSSTSVDEAPAASTDTKEESAAPPDGSEETGAGAAGGGTGVAKEELMGACGGSEAPMTVSDLLKQQNFEKMYAVQPLTWCPHLETVQPLPARGLDTGDPCDVCGDLSENWVCLVCYKVFCSRFVNEHMLFHGIEAGHLMVLSYADLSVWCYGCDHYVDNQVIYPMKKAAHRSKFGEDLP
ncbi:histone deacetylase 6-like isoform X2 [Haliotis rufescens]|uniref:histone deacetylase 6-like isoform X2 n=1 Tax=Haliotis rufescens TaxID=6454 RepID=UPI00201EAF21|nr:histone deacetylase 6-like isoform X2 [Haliotis rufescens]